MASENAFSKKLAAMILLITDSCQREGSTVSRTSLNKLLFFSDLVWFLRKGVSLSDVTYQKLDYGPVPINIRKVRNDLLAMGFLTENMVDNYGYPTYLYCPSTSVKILAVKEEFEDAEFRVLSTVSKKLGPLSASALSNYSHMYEPWKSASWFSELDLSKAKSDKELLGWLGERGLSAT